MAAAQHGWRRGHLLAAGATETDERVAVAVCNLQIRRLCMLDVPLLLFSMRVALLSNARECCQQVCVQRLAACGKMPKFGSAEWALRTVEAAHRMVKAPKAKRMATVVDGRLMQHLQTYRTREVLERRHISG